MMLLESISVAMAQLWANKLRSALTLLGMLIGVGSVVGIVSISEGLRRTVTDEFGKLGGANLIFVMPQAMVLRDGRWVRAKRYVPMTLKDLFLVQGVSDRIASTLPILDRGVEVRYRKASYQGRLSATMPAFIDAFNWEVETGRFLSDRDLKQRQAVCVLGQDVVEETFGEISPLGYEVKLDGVRHTVVGVMEERVILFNNWGNQILVPVTAAQRRLFGSKLINGLFIHTVEPDETAALVPLIEATLKREHGRDAEYRIDSGQGILDEIDHVILIMKLVTGGVAGISLVVGGIGIMNIMLVSVTERTREIGIRKALGAKPGTLMLQFVVEAIVLSVFGGLLGVASGVGLGLGISQVIEHFAETPFPSVVSWPSVALALGISVTIGLFFGIYPAARAARLDPVDALSHE